MSTNESVSFLIKKAGLMVGSEYRLAKALGIPQQHISAWKSGERTCTPGDRARLAHLANESAIQELVRATLDSAKGIKKEQLQSALGKWLHQNGEGLSFAAAVLTGLITVNGLGDLPRCIKRRLSNWPATYQSINNRPA